MEKGTYTNRKTGVSVEAALSVSNGNVHLYLHDAEQQLLVWSITALRCHFSGNRLEARHGEDELLECYGPLATEIYAVWSGKGSVRKAERMLSTKTNTAVALICAIFFGFTAIVYFLILPWVGEKAATLIPQDLEMELGRNVSQQFSAERSTDRADSLLNTFGKQLDFNSEYPLQLHVLHSDEINAFAVPGGNIFVYSGIIEKMDSYEQLVALLGHESSHVEKRHSLKSICRSAASGIFIAVMFGNVSGVASGIASQADEFRQLQYSRELETEADLEGLRFMRRNRIDQRGMLDLLRLLESASEKMPELMKYLSTHPDTAERIRNVDANLDEEHAGRHEKLAELFEELKRELGGGVEE